MAALTWDNTPKITNYDCSTRPEYRYQSPNRRPKRYRRGSRARNERCGWTWINRELPPRGGNKVLKRAMFPSAFRAPSDPVSRADYDRTRAQQKKHNDALIARALRRTDVLDATLRTTARRPSNHPASQLDRSHTGSPAVSRLLILRCLAHEPSWSLDGRTGLSPHGPPSLKGCSTKLGLQ